MKAGILSIVGPTAVGKTAFAQFVAEKLLTDFPELSGIDFISADSRQVYQGLKIVSGADISPTAIQAEITTNNFHTISFVDRTQKTRWFGISCIRPDQDWSVAHFRAMAQAIVPLSLAEKRLPIIVGGTGLYVQQALTTDPKLLVPPNEELRQQAAHLELEDLQAWVKREAPEKFSKMNASDQANPRRLIRVLEIAHAQTKLPTEIEDSPFKNIPSLVIGLSNELENLEPKIKKRVIDRWKAGAPQEVARLPDKYPNQKLPVFSATGIKPILAYISDQVSAEEAQQAWFIQERQYAKRQFTWWKKQEGVMWFTITQPEWKAQAYQAIAAWLHSI